MQRRRQLTVSRPASDAVSGHRHGQSARAALRYVRLASGAACALACALLALAGCQAAAVPEARAPLPADASRPDARQELDEQTGVTLQIVRRPIVLSRARTDVAANVRDYVTLVAVQQDEAGHYSTWLIAHQWSTVDPRLSHAGWIADGRLVLIADGRELPLTPSSTAPGLLRHRDWVFAPKAPASASFVYALDLPTLRYLSAAQQLTARFEADPLAVDYLLWADGRSALRDWLSAAVE